MRKPKLVLVKWYDAIAHAPGWQDTKTMKSALPMVYSVGWMIKNTKKSILLVADHGAADDEGNRPLEIPRGMVVGEPIPLVGVKPE